jgi:hypothetical protein
MVPKFDEHDSKNYQKKTRDKNQEIINSTIVLVPIPAEVS